MQRRQSRRDVSSHFRATMKKTIYILTFTFGLFSCNNQTTEKKNDSSNTDTLQTYSTDKPTQNIYIKDKSQYDQTFISGLIGYNEPIKLIDNYILVGNDTTYFPNDLPLYKEIHFRAVKAEQHFLLTVMRINQTSLTYNLEIIKDNETVDFKNGKAILGSMFFLASENDEDDQTGLMYGSSEYWDKSSNCWFSIRVGIGSDDNGKQRAMLNYGCEDKSKPTLNLEECPTLRTY